MSYTVVVTGFPGVGKSWILNAVTETTSFRSSESIEGVTTLMQSLVVGGIKWIDTPGQRDVFSGANVLAIEIQKALVGNVLIIYVLTADSGRIDPDHIKLLEQFCFNLATASQLTVEVVRKKILIVLNKCSPAIMNMKQQLIQQYLSRYNSDNIYLHEFNNTNVSNLKAFILSKNGLANVNCSANTVGYKHWSESEMVTKYQEVQNELARRKQAEVDAALARQRAAQEAELNRQRAEAAAAAERARIEQERVRGLEIISRVAETQRVDAGGVYQAETSRKTRWHRFGHRDTVWYENRQNVYVQTRECITRRNGTVEYTPWGNTAVETKVVGNGSYHC